MKSYNIRAWMEAETTPANMAQTGDQNAQEPATPDANQDTPIDNLQPDAAENPNVDAITNEPKVPDMPDPSAATGANDFDKWRKSFFKLSVAGDINKMMDSIDSMRDLDGLESYQRKFIEDNIQILFLRQDSNIDKLSKSIRKSIKSDLDRNNPGVSVSQILSSALTDNVVVNNVFYKLMGLYGAKGDYHRKFIASLLGAVQVGGGGSKEDIVFNDKEYSVNISTRLVSEFGEVNIGKWSLQEDDSNHYLTEPETNRLQEGSPEEKKALIHRVIVESLSNKFKQRSFLIQVVDDQGGIYYLGWDLGESLVNAYQEGLLIVKTNPADAGEAVLNSDGEIIPLSEISIDVKIDDGRVDNSGNPVNQEVSFLVSRGGVLYFTASLETISKVSGSFNGMFYLEQTYTGNPSEIKTLMRCVPSASEILLRRC